MYIIKYNNIIYGTNLFGIYIYIYICNKVEFVYTLLRQRPVEYNNDNLI